MRTIKSLIILFATCFSIQILASTTDLPTPAVVTQNLDGIAAVVNNGVITETALNKALKRAKSQMSAAQASHIDRTQLRKMILDQLINQKLLLEMAKQGNLKVTSAQLKQAIAHIAAANNLTSTQLEAKVKSDGLSFADYKAALKKEILIHQVQMRAIGHTVNVTADDVSALSKKYKAQINAGIQYHVLDLHVDGDYKKASTLSAQWKKGSNPDKAATSDLGWQSTGTLPTIFVNQLQKMSPEDISAPVKAPNGYHILKLVAIKGNTAKMPTKAQLEGMAFQERFQKASKKWLAGIRKSAYIQIN